VRAPARERVQRLAAKKPQHGLHLAARREPAPVGRAVACGSSGRPTGSLRSRRRRVLLAHGQLPPRGNRPPDGRPIQSRGGGCAHDGVAPLTAAAGAAAVPLILGLLLSHPPARSAYTVTILHLVHDVVSVNKHRPRKSIEVRGPRSMPDCVLASRRSLYGSAQPSSWRGASSSDPCASRAERGEPGLDPVCCRPPA